MILKLRTFGFVCALGLFVALGAAAQAPAEPGVFQLVVQLQQLEAAHRAARQEGLKNAEAWAANRNTRATERRREIAQLWGNVVGTIDARASLRMDADRMARLNRMLDLAEQKKDSALVARLEVDVTRELTRHAHTMQQLSAREAGK